mgnify:CR=1 FL=1
MNLRGRVSQSEDKWYCTQCKDECGLTEETWDYGGTHCTHGQSGVHHSGVYVSDCCLEEVTQDIHYCEVCENKRVKEAGLWCDSCQEY